MSGETNVAKREPLRVATFHKTYAGLGASEDILKNLNQLTTLPFDLKGDGTCLMASLSTSKNAQQPALFWPRYNSSPGPLQRILQWVARRGRFFARYT